MERQMSGSQKSDEDSTNHLTEDQLIQELKSHELYENNMTANHMKDIINVLKESQQTADGSPKSSKKTLELQHRPSYCREVNANTSAASDKKMIHTEMVSNPNDRKTFQDECSDSSSDCIFLTKRKNNFANGTKELNINKNRRSAEPEISTSGQQETQNWKINPLDCVLRSNDVPLRRDYVRPTDDSVAQGEGSPVSPNQTIAQLNNHLRHVAELWLIWRRNNSEGSNNGQWGSTIKVGVDNGSLDNDIVMGETPNEPVPEVSDGLTRKRRACTIKSSTYYKDSDEKNDGSSTSSNGRTGCDDESRISRKRKKCMKLTRAKRTATSRSTKVKAEEDEPDLPSNSKEVAGETIGDALIYLDDSDGDRSSGNEKISRTDNKLETNCDFEESPEMSYPRRIVPPNPTKIRPGRAHRKTTGGRSNRLHIIKKNEHDDEDANEEEVASNVYDGREKSVVSPGESIVELSVDNTNEEEVEDGHNRVSGRLQRQCERLKRIRKEEEHMEIAKIESNRIKEQQLLQAQENKIKKRIREEAKKAKLKEEEEKSKRAREKLWIDFTNQRSRERGMVRTELGLNGRATNSKDPNSELMEYETIFQDSERLQEVEDSGNIEPDRIPCPICSKLFSPDDIVNHAASCEEYNCDTLSVSRTTPTNELKQPDSVTTNASSKWYVCQVCGTYKTVSGNKYEDHVSKCIENQMAGSIPS